MAVSFLHPLWRATGAVEVLPVNYMNDSAVVITTDCPSQLIPRLTLVADLFVRTCRKHGLSPNFGAGKMEALVRLAGASSQAAMAALSAFELAASEEGRAFLLPLAEEPCG